MKEHDNRADNSVWKDLQKVLRRLPLEECLFERHPVTGELGWHAPKDKAFKVTGKFIIYHSQSSNSFSNDPPISSSDHYIAEHEEEYREFLKQHGGDKTGALRGLIEDDWDWYPKDLPPTRFYGKWLVLSPDIDEIKSPLEEPTIQIKNELQAEYNKDYFLQIDDLTPNSSVKTTVLLDVSDSPQIGEVIWWQYYAEPVLGFSKIKLVTYKEEKPEFFIPTSTNNRRIMKPESVQLTKRK